MIMLETGDTGKAVSAESDGALYSAIIGSESYVLNVGKKFTAEIQSNNKIKINDGSALVNGRHVRIASGDSELITINNGSHGLNRKDIIVIRYQKEPTGIESVKFLVIQGEETSLEAKVPSYTKGNILTGSTVVDFPLYEVSLTGINITEIKKLFEVIGTNADLANSLTELNGKMNEQKYKVGTVTLGYYNASYLYAVMDLDTDKWNGSTIFTSMFAQPQTPYEQVISFSTSQISNNKVTIWARGSGFVNGHSLLVGYLIIPKN